MTATPEWIEEEVVYLFHQRQLAEHGGIDGIRDEGMLLSALSRPEQLWHYDNPKPDLCSLAAAHAFGLAKNHSFLDGNKRTAAIACELFLNLNGTVFSVGEEEKYPRYLALAAGELSEEEDLSLFPVPEGPSIVSRGIHPPDPRFPRSRAA